MKLTDDTAFRAVRALGGVNYVAAIFDLNPNVVRNWYHRRFPPETYATLAPLLRDVGFKFSDDLFNQYPSALGGKAKAPAKKPRKNGGRK